MVGSCVILGAGLVHGLWTDRWSESPQLQEALAWLDYMPGAVGRWHPAAAPLDPREIRGAGAAGAWSRTYTFGRHGAKARVIVLCGRPGPLSVHRPEHCYRGAGFEMASVPARCVVKAPGGSSLAEVWTARFTGQDESGPRQLRIFWTWYAGGHWQAADWPRFRFARYPVLYKLYVVTEAAGDDEDVENDPGMDLLRKLIPELTKSLSPQEALQ
jgi:hypothetical protein